MLGEQCLKETLWGSACIKSNTFSYLLIRKRWPTGHGNFLCWDKAILYSVKYSFGYTMCSWLWQYLKCLVSSHFQLKKSLHWMFIAPCFLTICVVKHHPAVFKHLILKGHDISCLVLTNHCKHWIQNILMNWSIAIYWNLLFKYVWSIS